MDETRFDNLTRALAAGMSRRSALRSLVGTALGLAAGTAMIKARASNMDCAAFCAQVFGPGPERGKCVSDAANGVGLCIQCGANPSLLCTKPDGTKSCPVACVPNEIFDPATCQCICVPIECGPQDCGQIPNGCGGTLNCTGGCCVPTTCAEAGATCGKLFDGCGVLLDCGECTSPETCGGDGIVNQCGCTPITCEDAGVTCGPLDDGCGVILDCGPCACANCGPIGMSCSADEECCSGFCSGVCVLGENGCLQTGDTCDPQNVAITCCRGYCVPGGPIGCCSCSFTGGFCTSDDDCCDGYCVPTSTGEEKQCCTATGDACFVDSDCCGGHCVDGICDEGAAGTPCRFTGDCINACEDFLCTCSTANFCYDDADCCAGFTCNASEFTVPPFAGVCG